MRLLKQVTGFERKTIYGCDSHNGGRDSAYLTRIVLLDLRRFGKLCIHIFHRGDAEDTLHDHPWGFASLIVRRGYIEHVKGCQCGSDISDFSPCRRKWPGMILFRRPEHAHRVELVGGPAITLVWMSARKREWGFFTPIGWIPWQQFFKDKGC